MKRLVILSIPMFFLILGSGCKHCRHSSCCQPRRVGPAPPVGVTPVPFPNPGVQGTPVPGTPVPGNPVPGNPFPSGPPPANSYSPPPSFSYTPPARTPTWHAPKNNQNFGSPNRLQPIPENRYSPPRKPLDQEGDPLLPGPYSKKKSQKPIQRAQSPDLKNIKEKNPYVPPLPVGIPQFAMAKPNVANGLKPSLDGGLDWLQANNYKRVLHLVLPGKDSSADQKQVAKRGMQYVRLEVSPQTLSDREVKQFNQIVRDESGHPLFVYDENGYLTGGMWYIYFRLVEDLSPDAAHARAGSLGLREDRDDAHRDMWLAIQNYLSRVNS